MRRSFTRIFGLLLIYFSLLTINGQELSTLGKTFWLTFVENIGGTSGCNNQPAPQLKIVISCNKATTGTVKNPIANVTMPFSIGAGGGVDTVLVPASLGYVTGSEANSSRSMGLLVQCSDTIAVSAQNTKSYSADASLIYPIDALGVDYRIFSHMGDETGNTSCYKSCFAIVATQDNTEIDITPACNTEGSNAANSTFTITLDKGETYMVKAATHKLDLTGTLVRAKDCKPIAVFGGATRASVKYGSCQSSYDQLYEELMPVNLWGKKFIVIPTIYDKGKQRKADMVKVVAHIDKSVVRVNGKVTVLNAGENDTFFITSNTVIVCSKPIGVCQYGITEACDGVWGGSDTDPMMMWVTPLEQSLKEMSFVCENAQQINKFFLNVIVKTAHTNSFTIDGAAPAGTWYKVDKDQNYSYLQQDGLTQGQHKISSPYGFSAVLYAYGDHGSYGFNAGSSIKPLSFYSEVNGKSSADFESDSAFYIVCEDAVIPFSGGGSDLTGVTWKWILKDKNGMMSGFPKQFKSFAQTFDDTGVYDLTMIAQRPTNGVCNGLTSIDDTVSSQIIVYKKPDINLLNDTTICIGNSLYLTSTTDGDSNYTFTPSTWLSCSDCFMPLAKPLRDTTYRVTAKYKGCSPSTDTVRITLRDSFFLSVSPDTTICRGTNTLLEASAVGGLTNNLTVTWDHGLGVGLSKSVSPKFTTTYMAVLTDGCTRDSSEISMPILHI
ncbi:MAG: IgGFc-binding protein [Bacteroidia bacterium]